MKRHGFTLIETMVVLAIVGFLAALAVPSLIGLTRRARVSTEATTMTSLFSMMRTQSLTRGMPTVLCIRGKSTAGSTPETLPGMTTSYRKRVPVVPPAAIDNVTAGLDRVNANPDLVDKVLDSHAMDDVLFLDFPTGITGLDDTKTIQFVYDMNGQVTAFIGDTCDVSSNGTRTVLAPAQFPLVFFLRHQYDPAAIFQPVQVRRDGTVALP